MSRYEQRKKSLRAIAQNGFFNLQGLTLFPSEVKRLNRDGFDVVELYREGGKNKVIHVNIYWKLAYKAEIPIAVSNYINGITNTFPQECINNLAQELYVISSRSKVH